MKSPARAANGVNGAPDYEANRRVIEAILARGDVGELAHLARAECDPELDPRVRAIIEKCRAKHSRSMAMVAALQPPNVRPQWKR